MSNDRREQRPVDGPFQGEEPLARLYQQTKEEAPPSHLDAAVLAAARRAAQPSSRRVRFLPSRKWAVSLSLAAALLVSIGVVRELRKEIAAPILPTSSAPFSSPLQRIPESTMRSKELNREEKTSPPEKETRANTKTKETAETLGKFAPATPKPPAPSMESQLGGVTEEPAHTRGIASQAFHEESPVANVKKNEEPMAIQSETSPASVARRDTQPSVTPAMLGARLEEDKGDTPAETETPSQLKKERSISATRASGNAPVAVEQKNQGRIDVLKDEVSSPEAWIAKINELRRAGKLTEAEASLKKFKERYPEYPVEKFLEQTTTSSP